MEHQTSKTDSGETLITGDFYVGAFGPTLLLIIETLEGVQYLRRLVDRLAATAVGTTIALHREPAVSLQATISELDLLVTDLIPAQHLEHKGAGAFVWRCTDYEWETTGLLLEPFLEGRPGHQHMTNEYAPHPNLTVSFGENLRQRSQE